MTEATPRAAGHAEGAPTTLEEARDVPGARRPDRVRRVDSDGLGIAVSEWGDPGAPPLALAHGGFDFAGTFDVFAPMLADGGWRVVAWDQRGHGDSDRAHLYSWDADLRDAAAVVATLGPRPVPFVGHSKGGNLVTHLANALPHRVSALVNLDGLPSHRAMSDVADHERARRLRTEMGAWLAHRRSLVGRQRRPGTIDELARRRGRMNPRMSPEWLRYLVTVGAEEGPDGWRWKIDPSLRMGGFGPWRPQWSLLQLPGIGVPLLGVLGLEPEVMGWGTEVDEVEPYLPAGARFEALEGVGHFVHIEQPRRVADMVLEFLA
jgi:pimeloyl-ACP methyl ester carboxylesterase